MEKVSFLLIISIFLTLISLSLVSAVIVDAEYITLFPGEQEGVTLEIENNENFDIEDVSVALILASVSDIGQPISLPFTIVGSSEKDVEDLDEDDDDKVTFTLRANSDITPGDYNIPYIIKYFEDGEDEELQDQGSFGIRVSAKTEIDFGVVTENNIIGKQGTVALEIINEGLGDLKSVSVEIFPQGFELLSKEKVFVGSVDAEDFELVTFDVLFKEINPKLSAKVTFKDFDNVDQSEIVSLPIQVYTVDQAKELGLIKGNTSMMYIVVVIVLVVAYIIYRRIKKRKKNRKGRK